MTEEYESEDDEQDADEEEEAEEEERSNPNVNSFSEAMGCYPYVCHTYTPAHPTSHHLTITKHPH